MYRGQTLNGNRMFAPDRHFCVVVIEQPTAKEPGIHDEILAAKAALNRDLPDAAGAEKEIIPGSLNSRRQLAESRLGSPAAHSNR